MEAAEKVAFYAAARRDAKKAGCVTRVMIRQDIYTQRELRIMGWVEDPATGDWHPDALPAATEPPAAGEPGTSVAILDDAARALRTRGDAFVAPLAPTARHAVGPSRHHRQFYSDYEVAKQFIHQAIGDISEMEVFGRTVLCAIFCRPNVTPAGVYLTTKEVKEDQWQHKAVLVLKCGPSAFTGDASYIEATYGAGGAPKPGDWLFARPEAGVQMNCEGERASRPQGVDHRGEPMDIFDWDGWPCRVIPDDDFIGRVAKPQSVV